MAAWICLSHFRPRLRCHGCTGTRWRKEGKLASVSLPVGTFFTRSGWREALLILTGGAILAALLTFPLVARIDRVARADNSDGQFSLWNVAWVARTLVTDPRDLFDANIFYPHRSTLAFSEHHLAAGVLAAPVYWATGNPYLAVNVVLFLALALAMAGGYYLVRYLTGDRRAALIAGICFAFCPYFFGRTSHIQLLLTGGLPFSLLAFHRLADQPTWRRGVLLGLVVAAQATASGYYAILTVLMIGFAAAVVACTRRAWTDARYWGALALAAGVTLALVLPMYLPYLRLQRDGGFGRPLEEAALYSADWRAYFASSAMAHQWMQVMIGRWREVLFPGFVATIGGLAGIAVGWRMTARAREVIVLYASLGALAFWASLGPEAGLYGALYRGVPLLAWLRAPARFGILVPLALSVLLGLAVHWWLSRGPRPAFRTALLGAVAALELATPLHFREVPAVPAAYRMLAALPVGPVIEMPFLWREGDLHGHAKYMLHSTFHWMPLINGYSDHIPAGFVERARVLRGFPSRDAFRLLADDPPRYAVFHPRMYRDPALLQRRLREFAACLKPLHTAGDIHVYEVLTCRDNLVAAGD